MSLIDKIKKISKFLTRNFKLIVPCAIIIIILASVSIYLLANRRPGLTGEQKAIKSTSDNVMQSFADCNYDSYIKFSGTIEEDAEKLRTLTEGQMIDIGSMINPTRQGFEKTCADIENFQYLATMVNESLDNGNIDSYSFFYQINHNRDFILFTVATLQDNRWVITAPSFNVGPREDFENIQLKSQTGSTTRDYRID